MAGHNKWSKIRHKKGANDVKKALILGKASKSITICSKECKGDRSDMRLQAAIQHAKSVQLPRDRIEEAIEKGTRAKSGGDDDFFPLRFDAMMKLEDNVDRNVNINSNDGDSVQVACIITALSDNRNRTTQHVRHLVNKFGGEFLPTDHLNYLFHHVGCIIVEISTRHDGIGDKDNEEMVLLLEEELMECALEAGAINFEPATEDVNESENDQQNTSTPDSNNSTLTTTKFVVTTEEKNLWQVVRALRGESSTETVDVDDSDNDNDKNTAENDSDKGHSNNSKWDLLQFEHRYVLKEDYGEVASVHSDSPARESLVDFLNQLEENEDVHKVYHNAALV